LTLPELKETSEKKTIRTFAFASFLNDLGSDMIYPIWPLFVTTILGANMTVLGFIDGLGVAIVSISQAVSGYLSDYLKKRKLFIWTGYVFGALSRAGYALSTAWPMLIPFRMLDRMGKIRSAPRDAIIADISDNQNRGKNFGILRTMDNLGAVFGILICILLVKLLGLRNLMLLAAIPSLIAAVLILVQIRERKAERVKVIIAFVLFGLHKGALDPVQRTLVTELAPVEFRASSLGGFQMVIGLCALPASLIAGILWDKTSLIVPFYYSMILTFISTITLLFVKTK